MWETVIGLEVHVELSTASKIFCSCSTAFGGKPNSHCCPVCTGMPGALPVFNKKVLEYALKAAVALNCTVSPVTVFDRKNYFYPDLPKAYQISQLYSPIGRNGYLEITTDEGKKKIGIHEMHMEEDAGKLIHSQYENVTFLDYNRCGVPLIEIVSEPDFRSAKEVVAYLEKLKSVCEYLGISDCKMQEGSMRVDVNLSVRKKGEEKFGTRTETKNVNSFRAIERAIKYETERQIDVLESGGKVTQDTLHWNDDGNYSTAMRSKENAQDYRYFPDPDLLPIRVTEKMIEDTRTSLPEFAEEREARFIAQYGLAEKVAERLTESKALADFFEESVSEGADAKEGANWLIQALPNILSETGKEFAEVDLEPKVYAAFIKIMTAKTINKNMGGKVLAAMVAAGRGFDPNKYIKDNGMVMVDDTALIEKTVAEIIDRNPQSVAEYKAGKDKVFGFFVGQAMRALGGKANPSTVNEIIRKELNRR